MIIACAIRARWAPADGWSRRCARHCGRWPRRNGAKYASFQFHLSPTMSRPWERLIIMRGRRPGLLASIMLSANMSAKDEPAAEIQDRDRESAAQSMVAD